jgi:UDPglucose--hexose-1-phosphate uridylyltransferase
MDADVYDDASTRAVGAAAGASLAHLHAQLVALAEIPDVPRRELTAGISHFEQTGKCLWCETLRSELAANARVVRESEKFLIFCPASSRLPYEMCILPKCHNSNFETAAQADLDDLGVLWRGVTEALETLVPAYNWWIHSGPFDSASLTHYHWHIEVLPRSATLAGFEWSSGWHINTVCAEAAAETLRKNWPC